MGKASIILVLFDGDCGFCNRFVQFIFHRDKENRFLFTAQQSPLGMDTLKQYALQPMDSVVVVTDYQTDHAQSFTEAEAVFQVLRHLPGMWKVFSIVRILPTWILNKAYRWFAKHRYTLFGRSEACFLPDKTFRSKCIDS